ncbi:uncharacterized protein LOC143283291 [Babylonia areolata]|uniref:uncharacterized protein LOC143283291 n=1 Tax=Babylonia areolata TaxID=304850 RepID=UPI003FD417E7
MVAETYSKQSLPGMGSKDNGKTSPSPSSASQGRGEPQNGRHHDDMCNEKSRLASFAMYALIPTSGVWVTKLAEAGFYCTDNSCPVLRCAFCTVEVEVDKFRKRTPWEVHRALSPSCPLVRGEAPNMSMEEERRTIYLQYTRGMFATAEPASLRAAGLTHPQEKSTGVHHKGSGATVSHPNDPPPSQMITSGGQSDTVSVTHAQPHRLASATASAVSGTTTSEGDRHSSGSPRLYSSTMNSGGAQSAVFPPIPSTSALVPSTGTETRRRTTLDEPSTSAQPSEQSSPQALGSGVPHQQESRTSEHTRAQTAATNSSSPRYSAPSATYQTARPAERTEAGAGLGTGTAATATASHPSSQSASTNGESGRETVTYAQLGIYTQEPKRPDFAITSSRVNSFTNWPHCASHSPEDMAEAGFYFVGTDDLVRCFYCKGGLKSWSKSLRPWVEHARFYPRCPFVGQVKGQEFIEAVQHLQERRLEDISEAEIEKEMKKRHSVSSRKEMAPGNGDMEEEAGNVSEAGSEDGARGGTAMAADKDDDQNDSTHLKKAADELESKNHAIINERICKICQVHSVGILFLPCGHLVSCSQCAPALRTCAICRQRVKGRVRVLSDTNNEQEETESEQEVSNA